MRKHEMEKAQLIERMNEQSETVHHLTHHVHLLQSAHQADAACPPVDLNLSAGTFGGQYPLFFKRSEQKQAVGATPTGNVHISEPWPLSDHMDQINSVNISQMSTSFAPNTTFSTALPSARLNPNPATTVKNGMYELYQQNRELYQQSTPLSQTNNVSAPAYEGRHTGSSAYAFSNTGEKTEQVMSQLILGSWV